MSVTNVRLRFHQRIVCWLVGRIRWARGKCPGCGQKVKAQNQKCGLCKDAKVADLMLWSDFKNSL